MNLSPIVRAASISVFAMALCNVPALSQDVEPLPVPDEEMSKFLDRDRLVDTLMRDDALTVDAVHFYVTLSEYESDIWVTDLEY